MRFLGQLLLCCLCALSCVGPSAAQDKAETRTLVVGLMPYLSTRTLMANYQPVADALQQSLKQPVTLLTAPNFDVFVERVLNGDYDVALLAPHYARLAIKEYGYAPLLLHKAPIRGILVTGKDAPLKSFDELRGQSIAIVDRSALIVIAGALTLAENGLKENQDYRFVETVTHSSALHNAISGKARAALVSHSTLVLAGPELQQGAQVWRDIAQIPGQFYVAHNRLPPARQHAIKAALLAFEKSPEGIQFFEKTKHGGFREPSMEDNTLLDRTLPETRKLLGKSVR